MKRILFTIAFLLVFHVVSAVPPMPGVTFVIDAGGNRIAARIYGDDFFHYTLTDDGYLIDMQTAGPNAGHYVYAYINDTGGIALSNERVGSPVTKSSNRQFGMPEYVEAAARARINAEMALHPTGWFAPRETTYSAGGLARAPEITVTERKGVVLLVEFQNKSFVHTKQNFVDMLNKPGYDYNGAIGSAADYFNENSGGKVTFSFDVFGPYKVSGTYQDYGANGQDGYDKNARGLCVEAINMAIADGVDFTPYDQNGDNMPDMVFYFYAGYNEAQGGGADTIWPHKSACEWPKTKGWIPYACTSELRLNTGTTLDGIGTFCHEFSHVLGLADLYDTNGATNGTAIGMGRYSIMDSGPYNSESNAPPYYMTIDRAMVGWLDLNDLIEDKTAYRMVEFGNVRDNDAIVLMTKVPNYFYIFETRKRTGWDAGIPGEGVMAYSIDMSDKAVSGLGISAAAAWNRNMPNASATHQCALPIKANNASDTGMTPNGTTQKGWLYPYRDNDKLTPDSTPSSVSRYSTSDYFHVTNITYNSDGTGSLVFGQRGFDMNKVTPLVTIAIPEGGFTVSSKLSLLDSEVSVEEVTWYVNGVKSDRLVKGENEIKAVVQFNTGDSQTLYKYVTLQ